MPQYVVFFIFGLCIGSFLNVLIYRVPRKLSIVKPRSCCPKCGHKLKPMELIPLLSFILQGGKCKECKQPISIKYPIIELVTAFLWILPLILNQKTEIAIISALFSSVLVAVFVIDFEYKIIPNGLVLSIIVISIPLFFLKSSIMWYERLLGFLFGGGVLLLLALYSKLILKKEGMGGGDIKLMAACGLVLGLQNVLLSLFIASVIALLVIIIIITPIKKKFPIGEIIPFAPALTTAVVICYYFGDSIIFQFFIINHFLSIFSMLPFSYLTL